MSSIIHSLQPFIARRPKVIVSASSEATDPVDVEAPHNLWHLIIQTSFGLCITISPNPYQVVLDLRNTTKNIESEDQSKRRLKGESPHLILQQDAFSNPPRRYRISCDYTTTGLWIAPDDLKADEDPYIAEDYILSNFPGFGSVFLAWTSEYDEQFEKQELPLGSGNDLFEDKNDLVGFDIEGFLLGWRLALDGSTEHVEFTSEATEKLYVLKKGEEAKTFVEYFDDIDGLLAAEELEDGYKCQKMGP
ncbi:hypothetical protein BGZ57DRAFT_271761 [Hyaloscypha finlandica]|nr:hypothetical protein BGZ57DRAFT_271761 [Hyaloscypha finlandica]